MQVNHRCVLTRLTAVLAVIMTPASAIAQHATMTFVPPACAAGRSADIGPTYTEAGYLLSGGNPTLPFSLGEWCADAHDYPGPNIFGNLNGTFVHLTKK
ncbi:MAG: hypothetical protein ABJE47_18110 [bacterium]